jgi:hypothetical protein
MSLLDGWKFLVDGASDDEVKLFAAALEQSLVRGVASGRARFEDVGIGWLPEGLRVYDDSGNTVENSLMSGKRC